MVWLANAFSLSMLDSPTVQLDFSIITLERARVLAAGSESAVGHEDIAAIYSEELSQPVAVSRRAIKLAAGESVLVGQVEGDRLPPGTTRLPPGVVLSWRLVTVSPLRPSGPAVGPQFSDAAFVLRIREQRPQGSIETLVAIPTNDSVLAAIIALSPRKVLLLETGATTTYLAREFRDWAGANLSPPPVFLGRQDGGGLVNEANLVAEVEQELRATPRGNVAYLVTGGLSTHTAILTQLAHATGARAFHVDIPYREGRPDFASPERTICELDLPADTREIYALRHARALLRGGSPSSARESLQFLRFPGPLVQATRLWIDVVDARESLRLGDAMSKVKEALSHLDRQPAAVSKQKPWVALKKALGSTARAVQPALQDTGLGRLHTIAETLAHARREHGRRRLNLAALLYYRVAEAAVSERLLRTWGVRAREGWNAAHLVDEGRLAELVRLVHGPKARAPAADERLGLIAGLALLLERQDAALRWIGDADAVAGIRAIKIAADVRNQSLFAHGFREMTEADVGSWADLVEKDLLPLLEVTEPAGTWGPALGLHRFPVLDDDGEEMVLERRSP